LLPFRDVWKGYFTPRAYLDEFGKIATPTMNVLMHGPPIIVYEFSMSRTRDATLSFLAH
jgi:hypothetical protein